MERFHLAIFVIGSHREDCRDINEWMAQFDYQLVVRSGNIHVFMIFGDNTTEDLDAEAHINLHPDDQFFVSHHQASDCIGPTLEFAMEWTKERRERMLGEHGE